MSKRMKAVHMRQEESMTLVISTPDPRMPIAGLGRSRKFKDKRRKPRSQQKRDWKEDR